MLLRCKLEAELIMKQVNRSQDPILTGITLKWLWSVIEVPRMKGNTTYLQLVIDVYPVSMWKCDCGCEFFSCWTFNVVYCKRETQTGHGHDSFEFVVHCDLCWETFKYEWMCKYWETRLLCVCLKSNKICISLMLFGAAPINTCACFYEISPKRRLVNLSEIISEAGGVIDCGSNGKENQVGLTLTSHCQFSICLVVTGVVAEKKTGRTFSDCHCSRILFLINMI